MDLSLELVISLEISSPGWIQYIVTVLGGFVQRKIFQITVNILCMILRLGILVIPLSLVF